MKKLGLLAMLATFIVASGTASAALVYQLDTPAGTWGNVSLSQATSGNATFNADSVDIAVTLTSPGQFVSTGGHFTFTFNLPTTFSISGVTSGYTAQAANGAYVQAGFGTFNGAIQCTGCGPGGSSPVGSTLNFTVTATSAITPNSFTTGTGTTAHFTADILNGTTFVVGDSGHTSTVPEPISLSLVGGGLLALGLFRKRFVA